MLFVKSLRVDVKKRLLTLLDDQGEIVAQETVGVPFRIEVRSAHEVSVAKSKEGGFIEFVFPKVYSCALSKEGLTCTEVKG